MFEDNVLKKIPPGIKIFLVDCRTKKELKRLKILDINEWQKLYNIVYINSEHTDFLKDINEAKHLKALWLRKVKKYSIFQDFIHQGTSRIHAFEVSFKDNVK